MSLRMNHLVVKSDVINKIPLNELQVVVIENPKITITGHLLNALTEHKILTIVCNTEHLPQTFIHSVYGHHRQARLISDQTQWPSERKMQLWQRIIKEKITHQLKLLQYHQGGKEHYVIGQLIDSVELDDVTNKEGQAAKIYFNTLFSDGFTRNDICARNAALNYGYQILLAMFVKIIISKGYLTELGIKHRNEFNLYNLASDFMEVYRPIIDHKVIQFIGDDFEKEQKRMILDVVNDKIIINKKRYYLQQSIEIYVESLFRFMQTGNEKCLVFPVWQYK